jgi:hypothetical protein
MALVELSFLGKASPSTWTEICEAEQRRVGPTLTHGGAVDQIYSVTPFCRVHLVLCSQFVVVDAGRHRASHMLGQATICRFPTAPRRTSSADPSLRATTHKLPLPPCPADYP